MKRKYILLSLVFIGIIIISSIAYNQNFKTEWDRKVFRMKYINKMKARWDLSPIQINDKKGYIDKKTKFIYTSEQMNRLVDPYNMIVKDNGYWQVIGEYDAGLVSVIETFYSREIIPTKIGNKWGYVSEYGKIIIPAIYDDASTFNDGYAKVRLNQNWFAIDSTGKVSTPTS